jgi:Fe-S cluster assembly protein SufD
MSEASIEAPHADYLADLNALPANGQPDWLAELRDAGRSTFESSSFPHTKMEEWRHTNIANVTKSHFAPLTSGKADLSAAQLKKHSLAARGYHEIVIVDGSFHEELSSLKGVPEGALLGGLRANLDSEILRANLNVHAQHRNAYTALNAAYLHDGALVSVPRNTQIDEPIHILTINTGTQAQAAAHIRNLVVLEESSAATVMTTYVGLDDDTNYLSNIVEEISVGPNAQLKYYKAVQEGATGNHLATTEVRQDRDSRFFSLVVSQNGQVTRNQHCIKLAGEGAECALHGLYLNDGDRLIDNAINIHHTVPHCNSRIAYKGILDGDSKTVFTGKVDVDQAAQQTDSDQLSNNLLLSDRATIDTKPQLEIYADDVKCTHGATVGSHPDPIIFYFRSRGIGEATARGMLTYGFADEVISEIEPDAFRERLESYIFEKYSPKL